jgi:hypothetical protein
MMEDRDSHASRLRLESEAVHCPRFLLPARWFCRARLHSGRAVGNPHAPHTGRKAHRRRPRRDLADRPPGHPSPGRPSQREAGDQNLQFFGRTATEASGRFTFRTIIPDRDPGRAQHIHVKITPPGGSTLTTQFHFKGDAAPPATVWPPAQENR